MRRDAVAGFVRDTLGCTCPDEALRDVASWPPATGYAQGWVVGGRLLVAVAGAPSPDLPRLLETLRTERERLGLNRARLVLVGLGRGDGDLARAAFAAWPGRDERLHLHLLERLPD